MIIWINDNTVDGCRENEWIIGYDSPASRTTTTVGRFPNAAPYGPKVSHNIAIHRGGWIDRHGVHAPFGRGVIETARAAGHALWLRAETDKTGGAKSEWTQRIQRGRRSRRDTCRQARMLRGGSTQPSRIKAASGICQTIARVLLQSPEIFSLSLGPVPGTGI